MAAFFLIFGVFGVNVAHAVPSVTKCIDAANSSLALCPSTASPTVACLVSATKEVVAGAVIDCSGIDVRLTSSGVIRVADGTFALLADDLTVEQGRHIEAVPNDFVEVGMEISLTGNLTVTGMLSADNAGGDSFIAIDTTGDIVLNGNNNPAISAVGTTNSTDGGFIFLASGGSVNVSKAIFVNGTDGGDDTNINAGGAIHIDAGGDVVIAEELRVTGRWFGGGNILVASGGSIVIDNDPATTTQRGKIVGDGKSLTGYGGNITLAAVDNVLVSGPIDLRGGINNGGGEAAGGAVAISAGCAGIRVEEKIDLSGGLVDGGVFVAESEGPIGIATIIDASSRKLGGDGGTVLVTSGATAELEEAAKIYVDGHDTTNANENGSGGLVLITGCRVDVKSGASGSALISATGADGGGVALEGALSPLGSQDYSVRVGSAAMLNTTGTQQNGSVYLDVAVQRAGYCDKHPTVSCTLSSQCVFGCDAGKCVFANPDTNGVISQFTPAPLVAVNPNLGPCATVCD
ncbi:MAG TPA: hypothetical protein VEL28_06130 [Candidatus Binatia bacterium]|nr:hypothetical protein [Candidatus Binatia bacterium]